MVMKIAAIDRKDGGHLDTNRAERMARQHVGDGA
jgi:hypothetical protein